MSFSEIAGSDLSSSKDASQDRNIQSNTSTRERVHATWYPYEVLEVVFKSVINDTDHEERARTALALSHVCASFRNAALRCPELWTNISCSFGAPKKELVNLYLEWSDGRLLDVSFKFPFSFKVRREEVWDRGDDLLIAWDPVALDPEVGTAMVNFLPSSARWRSCSIHLADVMPAEGEDIMFLHHPHPHHHGNEGDDEAVHTQALHILGQSVSCPALQDLSIIYSSDREEGLQLFLGHGREGVSQVEHLLQNAMKNANPLRSWSMPQLRSLSTCNFTMLEVPAQVRAGLDTIGLTLRHRQVPSITRRIMLDGARQSIRLTSLRLSFDNCDFKSPAQDSLFDAAFPFVKVLHIELSNCTRYAHRLSYVWSPLQEETFINVTDLRLTVDNFHEGEGQNLVICNILGFPRVNNEHRFPSLESLDIVVRPTDGAILLSSLILPFDALSTVKYLRIRSSDRNFILDAVNAVPEEQEIHTSPISLKRITFDVLHYGGVVDWVQRLAEKMRNHELWDRFPELVVCGSTETIIPKDDVEGWCQAHAEQNTIPSESYPPPCWC